MGSTATSGRKRRRRVKVFPCQNQTEGANWCFYVGRPMAIGRFDSFIGEVDVVGLFKKDLFVSP